ncbi:type II toxin-antitoxin system PemK/MazF family toxin [Micromonospora sp. AMSO31t]|uniref:type II toxin-antitoxin system PemK/MazF family toxin n=1 Tax=Micromonospora sp. AMSO31t TaxID=2650566 RepID=UPI00124B7221|nr:type II toxin-antitoxin system PemK/MazF family toxin [Micromonospora sp. AMSO31t]KAB1910643.1 type II toxin-antitoxin system PemK/MazF family toxin [Micromonospora sp. AMSO31t]
MRDGLLWAAVIVACVAAGWLWGEWRRRAANRSAEAGRSEGRRDGRTDAADDRSGTAAHQGGGARAERRGSRPGGRPGGARPGGDPPRGRTGGDPPRGRTGGDPPRGRTGGDPPRGQTGGDPPRGRTGAAPRPRDAGQGPATAPRPGEIWWADVPYADGTGSKVRPCLVLRVDGRDAEVLKITSQDKSDRDDHLPIPTRSWDPDADHDSFLDISEPIPLPVTAFEDRAGACDPDVWRGVRRLPHLTT